MPARTSLVLLAFLISLHLPATGQTAPELASQILSLNRRLEVRPQFSRPTRDTAPETLSLLQLRRNLIEQLIATNPAAVRSVMLSSETADRLRSSSPDIAPLIETEVQWSGKVEGVVEDDFEHGRSRTHWFLNSGDASMELFFLEGTTPTLHPHQLMVVGGVGTQRVVSVEAIRRAHPASIAQGPPALNCTSLGTEDAAVLIMNQPAASGITYPSSYPQLATSSYWSPIYFGATPKSANSFWQEASFGLTSAVGDFYGPFTFTSIEACSSGGFLTTDQLALDAINAAQAGGVNFTNYSRISIIYPVNSCSFGGLGTIGCYEGGQGPAPQISHPYSITWIPITPNYNTTNYAFWGLVAHELGHNLGLNHSSSLNFGSIPLGALDYTDPYPSGGTAGPGVGVRTEYGDDFTVMGQGSWGCGAQYTAFNKSEFLGWMNRTSDLTELTSTGGTFKIVPFENTSGARALRVMRDPLTSSWLWLEYRQALGNYDASLSTCISSGTNILSGATVYYESPYSQDGHLFLLNMNAASSPNDFHNGALLPNQTWSDPYSLLTLTVNGVDNTGMTVTTSYAAPCATLQISNGVYLSAGGSGTIAVTAPGTCSWTSSTLAGWITINSGASGTGNGTVSFTVAANSGPFQRTGFITVQRQGIAIAQKGTNATFVSSLSPSFQKALSGTPTFTFNDPAGVSDIQYINLGFHDIDCQIQLVPGNPSGWFFFLLDPVTNTYSSSVQVGQNQSASNSNCTVSGSTSAVTTTSTQLQFTLGVAFAQSFAGSYRVTASVCDGTNGGSAGCPDHPISLGTWQVPPPVVANGQASLSPTSLSFGHQAMNSTSNSQPVTLTNIGSGALGITSITASSEFAVTNNCGSSVAAGASCTLNVTFQPKFLYTRTGNVTIVDGSPTSPHTVTLTGIGDGVFTGRRPARGLRPAGVNSGAISKLILTLGDYGISDSATVTCRSVAKLRCGVERKTAMPAGQSTLHIDARNVKPGRYVLKLAVQGESTVRTIDVPLVVTAKRPARKTR